MQSTAEKLFGEAPEQPVEPVETLATPAPEAPAEATQAAPPAAPQTDAAPAHVSPPPGYIPLAAVMDEREKRQEAERKAREFEERIRQIEAAKATAKAPDVFADPEGYAAHQQRQIQEALAQERQRISAVIAVEKYGEQTVREAEAAFNAALQSNPSLLHEAMQSPHPYDFAVKWHKRQSVLAQVGDDPDAFVRRRAAELGLIAAAPGAAPTPTAAVQPATPAPTPSLAGASAATRAKPSAEPNPLEKRLFG